MSLKNVKLQITIPILIVIVISVVLTIYLQNNTGPNQIPVETGEQMYNSEINKIYLTVNNHKLEVNLEDNSSATALMEKLQSGDITIDAEDYGNFEKVGALGFSLPTNDENITTTPGDLILYEGDKITLYYDQNTWTFTKLGHIDIADKVLKTILGNGNVQMIFSLN